MPEKIVTIRLAVPLGHRPGDYCLLHSNNGSGDVDFDSPHSTKHIPLMPNGAGNYGFGEGPFGMFPFGGPYQKNITRGFGELPFGMFPFGIGTILIEENVHITDCGDWKFALVAYDKLGNVHEGTPNEVAVSVHVAPPKPQGLQKESYDKDTDVLVLSVIDPYNPANNRLGGLPSRIWPNLTGGPYDGFDSRIDGPTGPTPTWPDPELPSRIN